MIGLLVFVGSIVVVALYFNLTYQDGYIKWGNPNTDKGGKNSDISKVEERPSPPKSISKN
jgi:hypothetical protein